MITPEAIIFSAIAIAVLWSFDSALGVLCACVFCAGVLVSMSLYLASINTDKMTTDDKSGCAYLVKPNGDRRPMLDTITGVHIGCKGDK